jgi:hypothetical protein
MLRALLLKGVYAVAISITWGIAVQPSRADSPITSTDFYEAYTDVRTIRAARDSGVLTTKMARYLSSDSIPIDVKAALVNALSWKFEGKQNALLYRRYLSQKYNRPIDRLELSQLTPDEVFVLGYLTVMDDYFHPQEALSIMEIARQRNPKSTTVAAISGLIKAQAAMNSDWCEVWQQFAQPVGDASLQPDLRPEAMAILLDYMEGYQSYCDSPRGKRG